MKKPALVAIFAHPDDEAFGPAGTLALYAKTHNVYLICVTHGEAGQNNHTGDTKNIANIREGELKECAKTLGIIDVFCLDYKDGTLSNNTYHDLAKEIRTILEGIKPEILITFEERGVSGHIDHITVTMVVNYIFDRVSYVKKLMYYAISSKVRNSLHDYFIYVPPGYKREEIDQVVDISKVYDKKVQALKKHKSQRKDVERMLKEMEQNPKEEYFFIRSK